jgi:tellurite methyltransferase
MSEQDRIRWDHRYQERGLTTRRPCRYLSAHADILPRQGRALDVAGGDGRNALWLAVHGLDVTIVDISEQALRLAEAQARNRGLALRTIAADLQSDPLPAGPWDVIVDCDFLQRSLVAPMTDSLVPGGYFVMIHPTRSNLQRHSGPSARFLLEDGELLRLIVDLDDSGLEIMEYIEGWQENSRHEARIIVRRHGSSS